MHFALDADKNHIDPVNVQLLRIGKSRIQLKVKILLGLWLTLNNVQIVVNLLKKIKAAII